ncbi:uncharacterized protein UV8b_02061 [Ustilaginoidea virens]|uniref:Uncharacterized protein n=1 Tax=Ustilaginoidea virens TaxID=1159556 RepID=A0A8E5HM73_USTVR|nr:uncharacterized protein UV8b_02061 [Ustilaginoidea virens]QUC17820.1 hypothetical protein UV8b_02061 [Ustilaginoidea virens]
MCNTCGLRECSASSFQHPTAELRPLRKAARVVDPTDFVVRLVQCNDADIDRPCKSAEGLPREAGYGGRSFDPSILR